MKLIKQYISIMFTVLSTLFSANEKKICNYRSSPDNATFDGSL